MQNFNMTRDAEAPRFSQRRTISQFSYRGYTNDDEGGTNDTAYIFDSGINANHEGFEGRATPARNFQDSAIMMVQLMVPTLLVP